LNKFKDFIGQVNHTLVTTTLAFLLGKDDRLPVQVTRFEQPRLFGPRPGPGQECQNLVQIALSAPQNRGDLIVGQIGFVTSGDRGWQPEVGKGRGGNVPAPGQPLEARLDAPADVVTVVLATVLVE
jgi:hypothetical protein